MKTPFVLKLLIWLISIPFGGLAATLYVDLNSPTPAPPFATWNTAATSIQDAIDVAAADDLVLVTNGVYATGGKVMFGDLTNRVALDKAITVRSVNGPWLTTIIGIGATNGISAVRCAWITNGATLQGFTLTAGATRTAGDQTNLTSGGGVLNLGVDAALVNCVVISNAAANFGAGIFQGQAINSAIIGNRPNSLSRGAVEYATLINSTVVSNWSVGSYQCRHTNTTVYYNSSANYSGGTFAFSCTTPASVGIGNITSPPQLLPDAIHLLSTSPCRGAGTNLSVGTDIDGQVWGNPPSIGCDDWREPPIIITQPRLQLTNNPIGFTVSVTAAGLEPFTCYWTRNGVPLENDGHYSSAHSPNLVATGVSGLDAGAYQVVVSNAFGTAMSSTTNLIFRFVNAASATPAAPYTAWSSAATNIQDAIDAAAAGEVVLVTNGIYRFGGKVMSGDLTNRVVLDKAMIVQSVNGSEVTIIEGNWNPTVTNGPAAVRCVWATNGTALSGFTIRGGATRQVSAGGNAQMFGGGIWGSSTNAIIANCAISTNQASIQGGGAYQVTLLNCNLTGNRAVGSGTPGSGFSGAGQGGGAANSNLRNCLIRNNSADQSYGGGVSSCNLVNCCLVGNSSFMHGGAVYAGRLVNCSITGNTSSGYSSGYGAAVHSATLTNCLVWGNYSRTSFPDTNYSSSTLAYCLSSPLASGVANIAADPQLLSDGVHVGENSPCRAAGANIGIGADIDGQVWANPPSIGCDEWQPSPVITFPPTYQVGVPARSLLFDVAVGGQMPAYYWYRDGGLLQEDGHQTNSHTANLKVLKFGPEHAGKYYVVVSNTFGMATSQVAQVLIHCVDVAGSNPISPYATWGTAATNIQNAIAAANAGGIVLVTNGVYATGGKIISGDLLNRVAIDKPLTVTSVNGYKVTFIEGMWDPASTNGSLAVRGVWMTNGSTLGGFTIRNGATRGGNFLTYEQQAGGGVWAASTAATIVNCSLTNNAARFLGGGVYNGTLRNCILTANRVDGISGGGGAAAYAELGNCTAVNNFNFSSTSGAGGGVYAGVVRNSIVRNNYAGLSASEDNYSQSGPTVFSYSCTWPLRPGTGNISIGPVFLDSDFHLPAISPVRGTGSTLYASGEDLDGEAWANPPSMGVDEVVEANLVGPISLSVNVSRTNTLVGFYHWLDFWDAITGKVSRIDWNFGDGVVSTNASSAISHWWSNSGNYTVTSTAYNTDYPGGISASIVIGVMPLTQPNLESASIETNRFKFSFTAQETAYYTVQYATNLVAPVSWQTLQRIFYSPGGVTTIADPVWTNSSRFYRVLVQ